MGVGVLCLEEEVEEVGYGEDGGGVGHFDVVGEGFVVVVGSYAVECEECVGALGVVEWCWEECVGWGVDGDGDSSVVEVEGFVG